MSDYTVDTTDARYTVDGVDIIDVNDLNVSFYDTAKVLIALFPLAVRPIVTRKTSEATS